MQMDCAVGHSLAALVTRRHQWHNLMRINEKAKAFTLISPEGLFNNAVNSVVDRYQEAKCQSVAFKELIPQRSQGLGPSASVANQTLTRPAHSNRPRMKPHA